MQVPSGAWKLPGSAADGRDDIFALILGDGILCRQTTMGRHDAMELLCPGDVLLLPATAVEDMSLVRTSVELHALSDLTVMVLGPAFLRSANRWPALLGAVNRRLADQQHRLASQSLAVHLPRIEDRILLTLWLLAERCGHVTPDGVALSLKFTHEMLSRLTGARRPTVTLALTSLRTTGCIIVRDDGRLILTERARRAILAGVEGSHPRTATDISLASTSVAA